MIANADIYFFSVMVGFVFIVIGCVLYSENIKKLGNISFIIGLLFIMTLFIKLFVALVML